MRSFAAFLLVCSFALNSHALFGIGKKKSSAPAAVPYSDSLKVVTADGCSLDFTGIRLYKGNYSWDGACPGGKAQGYGWLEQNFQGKRYKYFAFQMNQGKLVPRSLYYMSYYTSHFFAVGGGSSDCNERGVAELCQRLSEFIYAKTPFPDIKTVEGCQLQAPVVHVYGSKISWSGDCRNGLAQGYGYLKYESLDESGKTYGEHKHLIRFHEGKKLNGSYMMSDIVEKNGGKKYSFTYKVEGVLTPSQIETIKPCASIKPCKELMAAKALGGKNPEGMAPVSDFMPPVAETRGGGDRPPAFNPNPGANPRPPVNGGNGAVSNGGYGIGKYKAPKVACDDYALGLEMDKHSATINEGVGICDNAKATAKLYEFYANLLEASCPHKAAEVAQVREAVESAKQTIRGSCTDYNY